MAAHVSRPGWKVLLGRPGVPDPQDPNVPPAPDDDDVRWAELAEEMRFGQLARVRALAEQWRTGLLATTAFVGTVGIVKGPQTAHDLQPGTRAAVGWILLAAFVLLVAGSLLAMLAAYGPLGPEQLVTGERLRRWDGEQVESARLQLLLAQTALLIAVGLLGVAAAMSYLADPVEKPAGAAASPTASTAAR
jgi:hypothetical protein